VRAPSRYRRRRRACSGVCGTLPGYYGPRAWGWLVHGGGSGQAYLLLVQTSLDLAQHDVVDLLLVS